MHLEARLNSFWLGKMLVGGIYGEGGYSLKPS